MLSTEKWDNWGKAPLLFPFTALTWEKNRVFSQNMSRVLAQSVDKTDIVRSFISSGIVYVMIVTLHCE